MSNTHTCIQEGRITGNERDIENLKQWEEKQNGSLQKVEEKVDGIYKMLAGQFFVLLIAIVSIWLKG